MAKEIKGATVPKTAEQHAAARREAKLRQRASHHKKNGLGASSAQLSVVDLARKERIQADTASRNAAKASSRLRAQLSDRAQRLIDSSRINNITLSIATQIIENFRIAKATQKHSRTTVAILMLKDTLPAKTYANKRPMQIAEQIVRKAIFDAYAEIDTEVKNLTVEREFANA